MNKHENTTDLFRATRALLGEGAWDRLCRKRPDGSAENGIPAFLKGASDELFLPDYISELAQHEYRLYEIGKAALPASPDRPIMNPTLEVIRSTWRFAETLRDSLAGRHPTLPEKGEELFLMWQDPEDHEAKVLRPDGEYLFALKAVAEDMDIAEAARAGGIHVDAANNALLHARFEGLLIGPDSLLVREEGFSDHTIGQGLNAVTTFVIQWHLTNACNLHCRHCYDRSKRSPLTMEKAVKVIDDLGEFCRKNHVAGHACFSGGNPLLFPHFFEVYEEASRRGHSLAIMGNPSKRKDIERICDIRKPDYFQVSLEGLEEHNDYIRGKGSFAAVIDFLGVLRDLDIPTAVMLTLTKDNIHQVLPLGEKLRGHTNNFTFNRLSPVGEGASLLLPTPEEYESFLREYVAEAQTNPTLSYKDNLISIALQEQEGYFEGCTGYGCGAAFSFLAILPDGEVHACRKFPSMVGNIFTESLESIYKSQAARRYRLGSEACRSCSNKPRCGGCMSITSCLGGDPFRDRDPYCFLARAEKSTEIE